MSEYVVELPESGAADECIRVIGCEKKLYGYELREEIVRCRDCKYYVEDDMECRENGVRPEPDGFCKWGERRES